MQLLPPSKISVSQYWSSLFQNSECETILNNVVRLQRNANPEEWTPFTWKQYKAFCTHNVTESERRVLDTFVNGGKPIWNTSAEIEAGWMEYDQKTGEYKLTIRNVAMLTEKYPQQ